MRSFLRVAGVALSLLVAACDAPTVPGVPGGEVYDFAFRGSPGNPALVFHWPLGTTVRVFAEEAPGGGRPTLAAALRGGIETWNAAPLYGEYRLGEAADLANADVLLRWGDAPLPVEVPDLELCGPRFPGRAVTSFCPNEALTRLRVYPLPGSDPGRVRMLVSILETSADQAQVGRLVAHELGHVLGIWNHSPVAADLMTGGQIQGSTLSERDRSTVRVLYHTRSDLAL